MPSYASPTVALPFADLAQHGGSAALVDGDRVTSYSELADQVASRARSLGPGRRLTVLQLGNDTSSVVNYLAALAAGHVVALVAPGDADGIMCRFDADTQVHGPSGLIEHRRRLPAHQLHPDLALLLQTSGSTGAPRLVRLSHGNLRANAEAIARCLGLRSSDRAATTLPLHYTYGLSVLHSHLSVGASIAVTDRSVTDPAFLDWLRRTGVTNLPGVPHTYDLLLRSGFTEADLPDLRLLTQAGGRMPPEHVRELARQGAARGYDLRVMYGQTEATARMACMGAGMALVRPEAVGRAIPGGSFTLREAPGAPTGVGELVYRGPNVMLGYADGPGDLALGAEIDELPTGDLARIDPDGVVAIVGRRSHFAKIFGLRIDLGTVENSLADIGADCAVVDLGAALGVAWEGGTAPDPGRAEQVRLHASRAAGLPLTVIHLRAVAELPRTARGKVDRAAVGRLFKRAAGDSPLQWSLHPTANRELADRAGGTGSQSKPEGIRAAYAGALGIGPDAIRDTDSFVSLGGDSLTYVMASSRLERQLGRLPVGWHTLSVAELADRVAPARKPPGGADDAHASRRGHRAGPAPGRIPPAPADDASQPSPTDGVDEGVSAADTGATDGPASHLLTRLRAAMGLRQVDASVLLRAVAIVLVVGSHIGLMDIRGGAHLLIIVAGYNYARFQLSVGDRRARLRRTCSSVGRIVVPSVIWLVLVVNLGSEYGWSVLFGVNLFGPEGRAPEWRYWYLEALVFVLLAVLVVMAMPPVHRIAGRRPFAWAMTLVGAGLALRFAFAADSGPASIYTPVVVAWLFAVGWALAVGDGHRQRLLALAALAVGLVGYFDDAPRTAVVAVGAIGLAFVPLVRLPGVAARVAVVLAGASLFIYLTHWQVYPPLAGLPLAALIGSLAVGVTAHIAYRWLSAAFQRRAGRPPQHRLSHRLGADLPASTESRAWQPAGVGADHGGKRDRGAVDSNPWPDAVRAMRGRERPEREQVNA